MYLCYRNEGYPRVAPFANVMWFGQNRAQREGSVTIAEKSGTLTVPTEDCFVTNDAAEATQWARTGTRSVPQPTPAASVRKQQPEKAVAT